MKRVTRSNNSDNEKNKKQKKEDIPVQENLVVSIKQETEITTTTTTTYSSREIIDLSEDVIDLSSESGEQTCKLCDFTYTQLYKYRIHLLTAHIMEDDDSEEEQVPVKSAKKKSKAKKEEEYPYLRMDEHDITRAENRALQETHRQHTRKS